MSGLWTSLRRRPAVEGQFLTGEHERKVVLSSYYEALSRAGIAPDRSRGWSIERAVTEGYERVVWVFRCVNRIAGDSAALPFVVLDGQRPVQDHPLTTLLNDGRANDLETGRQFRKRLSSQVLLSKRGAFVEVTSSRGGTPLAYDLLPPGRTEPVPGDTRDPVTGQVQAIDHFRLTLRDGGTKELDPDTVRWFRDPHPIDPYSGVTPLEAIGMSIELDYFARLFNVSFLRNDGRPGGVLAVRGTGERASDIDERAMDRIEARFGRGPLEAGKISVIQGELDYQDLSGNPRDMSYSDLARSSKNEIMGGFGVGDSILGNSGEKTYANADKEAENYWLTVMPEHNGLIVTGFDRDTDDGLVGGHNTAGVPALQMIKDRQLERAASEVDKGLRSIHSYFVLAGREDEIEENAHTRALYMPSGRDPVPAREDDAEALGLGTGTSPAGQPPKAAPAVPAPAGVPAAGAAAPESAGVTDAAQTVPPLGPADTADARTAVGAAIAAGEAKNLRAVPDPTGGAPAAPVRVTIVRESKTTAGSLHTSTPDLDAWAEVEAQLAVALSALGDQWIERTVARITAPKARKGTRHWDPQYDVDTRVGTKALDSPRAVDEDRWQDDVQAAVATILTAGAVVAAGGAVRDLAAGVVSMDLPTVTATAVGDGIRLVRESALRQARALSAAVNARDQAGASMDDIVAAVRSYGQRFAGWARGLAMHAASAVTDGAREAAVTRMVEDGAVTDVYRQWITRKDARVRESHAAAHGQRRALGVPFQVGGVLLRYPGDPDGPLGETANCRCYLRFRARSTGRFVARTTVPA